MDWGLIPASSLKFPGRLNCVPFELCGRVIEIAGLVRHRFFPGSLG